MAKSPGTGENRGRRASDKRRAAEQAQAAEPAQGVANDRRKRTAEQPEDRSGVVKQRIAARAYELYVARGGTHGYDIEDWLQAERELLGQ